MAKTCQEPFSPIDQIDYDAFGNIIRETRPANGDRYKYAGYRLDPVTGFYEDNARWYAARTARFTSQDPLGLTPDVNPYRYVGNHPTYATDPSGLFKPNKVWKNLSEDSQNTWEKLADRGWKLVLKADDDGNVSASTRDFSSYKSEVLIDVNTDFSNWFKKFKDKQASYRSDEWAVDFENKYVYIDAYWESSATRYLKRTIGKLGISDDYSFWIKTAPAPADSQRVPEILPYPGTPEYNDYQRKLAAEGRDRMRKAGYSEAYIWSEAFFLPGGGFDVTMALLSPLAARAAVLNNKGFAQGEANIQAAINKNFPVPESNAPQQGGSRTLQALQANAPLQNGGVLNAGRYAQTSYSGTFSAEGTRIYSRLAGRPINTIDDLVAAVRAGHISPSQIEVNFIVRPGGRTLILNTRTGQALEQAGIPRSQWNAINRTGDPLYERLLSEQLQRNNLTNSGIANPVLDMGR